MKLTEKMEKQKPGPKPKYKKSSVRSIRFPDDVWESVPDVKSDFIIAATKAAVEKIEEKK